MAVTTRTLAVLAQIRLDMDAATDAQTRALVTEWARAWVEIRPAWESAIASILATQAKGKRPTRRQVAAALRATRAIVATQDAIIALAQAQSIRMSGALPDVTQRAARLQAELVASLLPEQIPAGHALFGVVFDRVDPRALDAIVKRTTQQVTSLTRPLAGQTTAAMKSALIRAIALGLNPRDAAALMLARVGEGFAGGLARAVVIARTEVIDAYRSASAAQDRESTDVLTGWQWVASLSPRTCESCWAMHGTTHPLSDPGPLDHQQGRCARVPVSKSWRELGFDIPEPASIIPDALSTFRAMPRADQVAVLGDAKLALLDSGRIRFDDLAQRRVTTGWRDSYAPRSLADLRRIASRAAA